MLWLLLTTSLARLAGWVGRRLPTRTAGPSGLPAHGVPPPWMRAWLPTGGAKATTAQALAPPS